MAVDRWAEVQPISTERLDAYLALIGRERESRPAEAMLADEIKRLREILVFADGYVVSQTGMFGAHTFALADLYAEDCEWAQQTIAGAGCHPRGRFLDGE